MKGVRLEFIVACKSRRGCREENVGEASTFIGAEKVSGIAPKARETGSRLRVHSYYFFRHDSRGCAQPSRFLLTTTRARSRSFVLATSLVRHFMKIARPLQLPPNHRNEICYFSVFRLQSLTIVRLMVVILFRF